MTSCVIKQSKKVCIGRRMRFREITIEDKNWIGKLRDTNRYSLTAYAFPALYMWRREMGLTVAGNEKFFIIHSDSLDGYFYPCGDEDACEECLRQLIGRDGTVNLFYMGEAQIQQAQSLGIKVSEDRDFSEYIYEWCTFAHPTQGNGHCIHDKVRKFSKTRNYTVRRITLADTETLAQITAEWENNRRIKGDSQAVLEAIDRMDELELQGIMVESGEDRAFTLAYCNTSDVYTFSIVKYTSGFNADVIAVCAHELAKALDGQGRYIDLEEDLGNEGMRRMKTAYHPNRLEKAYKGEYPG